VRSLLLAGGRRGPGGLTSPADPPHEEALLLELDPEKEDLKAVLRYRSTPRFRPPGNPFGAFKGMSREEDGARRLLLSAETEILVLDPFYLGILETITHPLFQDVHHAIRLDGRLYAVSTGLDCLVVLDRENRLVETRSASGGKPECTFDPDRDYRLEKSRKPHRYHPNHVFRMEEDLWMTRFEKKDAIQSGAPNRLLQLEAGRPHDGIVHEGFLWFTTVNGRVLKLSLPDGGSRAVFDLTEMESSDRPLGWCRGLWIQDGIAFVGFSRLRFTRLRRNLSWVKHGLRSLPSARQLPTRLVAYDLERRKKIREWPLEEAGMSDLFAVLPRPE